MSVGVALTEVRRGTQTTGDCGGGGLAPRRHDEASSVDSLGDLLG